MKKVDVPEPAKTLLEKTHGLLDKYLPKALPKGEKWAVGGGTMLAARWRHRLSNDLDILLHEDSNLRKFDGDRGREMEADFRATGAIEFDWDSDVCRKILYKTSKIDITVGRATPAEGKETADFGTGTAEILSNAQILSGKLKNRALNPPVRDLFDIAVADEADPESLRIAVNTAPKAEYEILARKWAANSDRYEYEQRFLLEGVPEKYKDKQNNAMLFATAAIRKHRYHLLEIEVTERGIEVRTENALARTEHVYKTAKDGRDGFERTGINAALEARGENPRNIWRTARINLAAKTQRMVFTKETPRTPRRTPQR